LLVMINWARHYFFREHAACRILPSEQVPPARAAQRDSGQGASLHDEGHAAPEAEQ